MFTPDTLGYLPETPSQTAGPYVHIGLIPRQAGFDIFENNLGESLLTEATKGERIRIEGRGASSPLRIENRDGYTTAEIHQILRRVELVRQ